ncbi:uncharacterized protein LOC109705663 [Ananas comosus]|uniref:Uncharacterized protein LOC109705663 n=1 Tax=Ananas comosus TaxID=4615 RepID=A0A6P5EF10_ANACO|nr:uncharacterized protein LOC109705663 [Ananas comosus]
MSGEQIQQLQEALVQQQAATTQVGAEQPPFLVVIPNAIEGVAAVAILVAAVAAGLGTSNPKGAAMEAAREYTLPALVMFKKFNPPVFDGEKVEPWIVESWIDSMETLFEDIYTLEKDKVHLATHCLEKSSKVCWKRVKWDRPSDLPPMVSEEFRGLIFTNYFLDSEKKKLQDKFRKLRHRDRSPRIYEKVQILKLTTFAEILVRALWAEHDSAYAYGECESVEKEKDKGKKRTASGTGGRSSPKRPPHYPRRQSKNWRPARCVICGGDHRLTVCPQRDGRCFKCGQAGHISRECPSWTSSAQTAASVQYTARQLAGLPPAMSAGRSSVLRQPEGSRVAPSGRVFAPQVEEPVVPDDVVAAHGIEVSDSPDAWWVYAPEHTFSVKEECMACPVQIGDWFMPADLLVLTRMWGFDVILGIDWLSKYYAVIDCESKVITFREPN